MAGLLIEVGVIQVLCGILVGLALLLAQQGRRPAWAAAFLLVLALEATLVRLPEAIGLAPEAWEWNWAGRLLSLIWVAIFWWLGPLTAKDLGLTWRILPGTGPLALLVALVLLVVVGAGIVAGGTVGDPDTGVASLFYHIFLGVAAEELVYRGVLLALLSGAVGGFLNEDGRFRWSVRAVLVILTVAAAYAMDTALSGTTGLTLDLDSFISVLVARAVFVWLRLYTGSLLVSAATNASGNLLAVMLFIFFR